MIYLACPYGVSAGCDPTAAKILAEYRQVMFWHAQKMLMERGTTMLAPCEFTPMPIISEGFPNIGVEEIGDVKLLAETNAVVVLYLDGWTRSPWVMQAIHKATRRGLPIFYLSSYEVNEWLEDGKVPKLARQPMRDISKTI